MKISRTWLQKYFEKPLPNTDAVAEALTFHAFEIEETGVDMLDVKVLPNRAADCLSHRGIARELAAILDVPLSADPLRRSESEASPLREVLTVWPTTTELTAAIASEKCRRYMGALVRNVKVGPSPEWLKTALESVGQRSINNVVDATNYVMLDLGQPLHAFDALRLTKQEDRYAVGVREANGAEKITVLTGEEYTLPAGAALITDAYSDTLLGIAGIKGGKAAEITAATVDIIVESANFDAVSVRKTAQSLKLFTDASARFQNDPSPELAAYGMRAVLDLITQVAGGELVGVVDEYPNPQTATTVAVSLANVNNRLGSTFTLTEVKNVFDRLGFSYTEAGETCTVTAPFERRDLVIPEDLVEEVGQIMGYDRVPTTALPPLVGTPDQSAFRGISRIKDVLTEHGYTEISTQSFASTGDVYLANPLDNTKPALRAGLTENMQSALVRGAAAAPRVLGPVDKIQLFEIGAVFAAGGEHQALVLGYRQLTGKRSDTVLAEALDALADILGPIPDDAKRMSEGAVEVDLTRFDLVTIGAEYTPRAVALGAYRPFSIYPFAMRDIAVWTPLGTEEDEVEEIILQAVGSELARLDLFDRFEKDGKLSYAYRLVFEAFDRTLTDVDLVEVMDRVATALNTHSGFSVR